MRIQHTGAGAADFKEAGERLGVNVIPRLGGGPIRENHQTLRPQPRRKERIGRNEALLRTRIDPGTAADIEASVRTNDRLVITQWVSTIDKIATKPAGTNGPTTEQRTFRERLGAAAWTLIEAKNLVAGLVEPALEEHLTKFWKVKIAPYGDAPYKPPGKPGREPPPFCCPAG